MVDGSAIEVRKDIWTSGVDQCKPICHGVLCIVCIALTVDIVDWTTSSGQRAGSSKPDIAVWIGDPVADWRIGVDKLSDCRIALHGLSSKRMASKDYLLHVWKQRGIVEVLNDLI